MIDMMKPDRPRPVIFRIRRGSGAHMPPGEGDNCLFPGEEVKDPHGGYELGEDGGQRGATHAHVKDKDKQRVQEQVQHSPDGHGEHARDAEPLGVDEIVHAKTYHDEQRAAQVDGEVGVRIGIGGVAGTEQIHQRPAKRIAEDGKDQAAEQEHGEGIRHDLFCLLRLPAAPCNGEEGRPAGAEEVGKGGDDGDDGQRQADACQRLGGRVGDVADVDPVHHVVQDIDELCARHGDSQAQDVAGHAPLAEITCVRCSRMHGKITF